MASQQQFVTGRVVSGGTFVQGQTYSTSAGSILITGITLEALITAESQTASNSVSKAPTPPKHTA